MEKEKVISLADSHAVEKCLETALWQWQFGPNPDPWTEKDASKWIWQDYSHNDCLIIEEAFGLNNDIAELKDYEIDLKRMLQVDRKLKNRIRRVRRQGKSRFMMEMPEPVAVIKDQKTMNQAFGTIQHFLDYIMKRTPEAYGLYQRLKMLSLDSKNHEFVGIVKKVVVCIEKGAETREKIVKTRSGPQVSDFLAEAKKVVNIIENDSGTLRDFLKAILRVYTMESFVCYWLNELLRSEDWEEINVMTPYLVCLVYTFQRSEYIILYQEPQGWVNDLRGFIGQKRLLCLYRGAALTKEHLKLYSSGKMKYFSWNGVTSTSRDQNVAMNFIQASLGKARWFGEQKVGVFFVIETDFGSFEDCEGMIDIFQNGCSQFPDEREVILAPGTVFKLQNTRLIENDIYEVSLRVKRKFEETKESSALLGILQDQAILEDKAIIDGLPSQQSFRLLDLLKGNKLIRKLEIRNSGLGERVMEEIENMRVTTNVKREDVKLVDNMVVVSSLEILAYYFSAERLNDIFLFNQMRFKKGGDVKNKYGEMKTLALNGEVLEKFRKNNQLKDLCEKITDASIVNLELSIWKIEPLKDVMRDFFQYIKELESLQNFKLDIDKTHPVSEESFGFLYEIIQSISTTKHLYLGFAVSEENINLSEDKLQLLASMQNLSLDLKFPTQISNDLLKNRLFSLSSLQCLSLRFWRCKKISDEELNHLKDGLSSLKNLLSLSLSFEKCDKISNEGLNHLANGLVTFKSLQHLSLDFSWCNKISDEGLDFLRIGLISLTKLQYLSLNFWKCKKISNEGLNHIKSGLMPLISLQSLSLSLKRCNDISDEGLNHLKDSLVRLLSLQHLSLSFEKCNKISNEGLSYLKIGLLSLQSLQKLSLDFGWCKQISDEGLSHLQGGLVSLGSLQSLSLNFWQCNKLSDEALKLFHNQFKFVDRVEIRK